MKTLGQFLQRENVDRMKEIKRVDNQAKAKGVTLGTRNLPKKDPKQAPKPAWESGKKESLPKMPKRDRARLKYWKRQSHIILFPARQQMPQVLL